ncbi:MAG: hypothetical protein HOH80_15305 [Rhodospirillaceae bacterium]|jgi:biotin operon repressor|nr:hypothetical protein [Rhodospirillales bacterium]MBT4117365.1 hypothetical protein [Rhodospirillaceae bacterium]MBT5840364.1 hypothetical protein [Rhodospirillaceae bacterium]MBT7235721.1 hypothetical protein [Rhodospirillaceae bacterium]MBT7570412.1 hypothetical protein [Rhodospirillaceae bacterium]
MDEARDTDQPEAFNKTNENSLDIMFRHSRHPRTTILATLGIIKRAQKLLASIPAVRQANGRPDNIIRLTIFLAEARAQGYEPDSTSIAELLGISRSTLARRIQSMNAGKERCPALVRQGHRLAMEVKPLGRELMEFIDYWADQTSAQG